MIKSWTLPVLVMVLAIATTLAFASNQEDSWLKGEVLYNRNCARCHGLGGRGTENGPPFLNRIYRPSHHSDLSFQMAALNGVRAHHWEFGDMPPVEGVGMAEVGMIIRYIRAIQREAGVY